MPARIRVISSRLQWAFRRSFWDAVTVLRYRINKAVVIPVPAPLPHRLQSVPLREVYPSIAIGSIPFSKNVPRDEANRVRRRLYDLQMWLARVLGQHLPGLPEVDPDPATRLAQAYRAPKRALFPAPLLPPEYAGAPDLGALALAGPTMDTSHRRVRGGGNGICA